MTPAQLEAFRVQQQSLAVFSGAKMSDAKAQVDQQLNEMKTNAAQWRGTASKLKGLTAKYNKLSPANQTGLHDYWVQNGFDPETETFKSGGPTSGAGKKQAYFDGTNYRDATTHEIIK